MWPASKGAGRTVKLGMVAVGTKDLEIWWIAVIFDPLPETRAPGAEVVCFPVCSAIPRDVVQG
jgi:hypothetical protein